MAFSAAAEDASIAVFEQHDNYLRASSAYGLSWALLARAAKVQGIQLVPQGSSWEGALNRLHSGKVNLLFGALKTAKRQQWAHFSYPLAAENSSIFTLPKNPIEKLEQIDLGNATLGVSSKSVQESMAIEMGFTKIYAIEDRQHLYRMLDAGRVDYLFFADSFIGYYCLFYAEAEKNCLKKVGPPQDVNDMHMISLKSNPAGKRFVDRLNTGLMQISNNPEVAGLFEQFGYSSESFLNWQQRLTLP